MDAPPVASVVGNGDGILSSMYEKDAAPLKSSGVGCGDGSMRRSCEYEWLSDSGIKNVGACVGAIVVDASPVASVVGNGDGILSSIYEKDAAPLKSSGVGCGDGSMRRSYEKDAALLKSSGVGCGDGSM